ncbi:forkhead box protein N2-like isoform X1 [Rhopalosiphum padi]|uniref:forkhead box protein N2-like isoform X1 n=2 Tax=Rhopalosiphum padi TaxID=40932 RepID=UPI00298E0CC8|nr:forkhead box protein N2-like isoform X1 [Rhopalosiphum padi]
MAPPRLSDEQKALSRQRRRDRRRELQRLRRADPVYRLAERARNTRARREQRNDPEYRKKERERDTRAHRDRRNRVDTVMRNIAGSLWTNAELENMAPDQVGPDEDTGVTALSNCPATMMNTTVFVTVPASPFPAREELSSENVYVGGDKDKGNSTDDNEDDDLTSLSWLQNKNLLKGVHELPKTDYADDASSDSRSSSGQSISPVRCWPAMAGLPAIINNNNNNTNNNNNNNKTSSLRSSSYDPKVHTESKPPYSFSCLIFMAIEDSPIKALPVKDIYGWIVDHFPYYKNAPTGWKNSVRHNLSLNKCFRKVEKAPNLGKGSLWMVEPSYRPCLIQALQKTPYTKGYSKKSTVNTSPTVRGETMETVKDERSEDEMSTVSDVDAATAMLVLKHGPHVRIVHDRDWQLTQTKPDTDPELAGLYPIVTICPSEDHTYDNCFKMDSLCKEDAEERRKIVEGADALLNLAGITTRRLRKRSSSVECIDAKRECTDTLRQMYLKKQSTDNNNEPASVIIEHHKDKFR